MSMLIRLYISAALRLAKKSKLFEGAKRGSESTLDSNLRAYLRLIYDTWNWRKEIWRCVHEIGSGH
jgi:hypothetical protein